MPNKDLTFTHLKGTRTAIHCTTQSEAEQVEKICGFENLAKYWGRYRENFCIDLDEENCMSKGEYGPIGYFKERPYTIIPAADFIAANSGEVEPPKKIFTVAEIRTLVNQVSKDEITFSRFVEILNEKANTK